MPNSCPKSLPKLFRFKDYPKCYFLAIAQQKDSVFLGLYFDGDKNYSLINCPPSKLEILPENSSVVLEGYRLTVKSPTD